MRGQLGRSQNFDQRRGKKTQLSSSVDNAPPITSLLDFIGDWEDSLGNEVSVQNKTNSKTPTILTAVLVNTKQDGTQRKIRLQLRTNPNERGQFSCGHYLLDPTSTQNFVLWTDARDGRSRESTSLWRRPGAVTTVKETMAKNDDHGVRSKAAFVRDQLLSGIYDISKDLFPLNKPKISSLKISPTHLTSNNITIDAPRSIAYTVISGIPGWWSSSGTAAELLSHIEVTSETSVEKQRLSDIAKSVINWSCLSTDNMPLYVASRQSSCLKTPLTPLKIANVLSGADVLRTVEAQRISKGKNDTKQNLTSDIYPSNKDDISTTRGSRVLSTSNQKDLGEDSLKNNNQIFDSAIKSLSKDNEEFINRHDSQILIKEKCKRESLSLLESSSTPNLVSTMPDSGPKKRPQSIVDYAPMKSLLLSASTTLALLEETGINLQWSGGTSLNINTDTNPVELVASTKAADEMVEEFVKSLGCLAEELNKSEG